MGVNDHKDISDQISIINVKEECWLEPNWFKQCKPTNLNNTKNNSHVCAVFCSVAQSCLFATQWTVACQAPLSMGILQARILECIAMLSSNVSSQPRD